LSVQIGDTINLHQEMKQTVMPWYKKLQRAYIAANKEHIKHKQAVRASNKYLQE